MPSRLNTENRAVTLKIDFHQMYLLFTHTYTQTHTVLDSECSEVSIGFKMMFTFIFLLTLFRVGYSGP